MPIPTTLPRGCTRSRGQSDVPHLRSLGGDLAHRANQLYMLTVRRESLVNKKRSMEQRLRDINIQLKEIEADMRVTGGKYGGLLGPRRRKSQGKSAEGGGNGHAVRSVSLRY